jgi:hypothetical protein
MTKNTASGFVKHGLGREEKPYVLIKIEVKCYKMFIVMCDLIFIKFISYNTLTGLLLTIILRNFLR